jgi:protein-glutamine gamma-glutamyltransferase
VRDDRQTHVRSRPATGWLTMLLALVACVAAEVAVHGMDRAIHAGWYAALTLAAGLVALGVGEVLRRWFPLVGATNVSRLSWAGGIVGVGVAIEALVRECLNMPMLLDVLLIVVVRDMVIALAMLSHHEDAQRSCNAFATFLIVFASASVHALWIQGLVVVFSLIGVWWLMGTHWESLQHRLESSSDRALPRKWLLTVPLALLGILVCVPVASRQIHALEGFMPTSGGRRDSSPMARSGIGDGDALVAGLDNIRSFAPIEDAPFMSSHEPTLYDLYDDMYNEPVVQKKVQRAISLPSQTTVRPEDHSMAKSSRPSRDFSTVRKTGKPTAQRTRELESRALFYVKGRVPLHLKLESFDLYDGVEWRAEPLPEAPSPLRIEMVHGRPWLRTGMASGCDFFAAPESHAIKVVDLDTAGIPSPNELTGVHIDQVAQADFFRWERPGVIGIDRPKLPDLLTVNVQSRLVDPRLFVRTRPSFRGGAEQCRQFGDDSRSAQVRTLAESWVEGMPAGWRQVERVIDRVRAGHVLDATAAVSSDSTHSVADFLLVSRRGPDYLFAGAAVWALRSLGYTARLASGFYADPRRYDGRSDHTPVMPADLHFWVEVHAGPGHWMTLDPTPGYVVLAPPLTLAETLLQPFRALGGFVARNPWLSLAVCAGIALFVQRRAVIADTIDEAAWRLWRHRDDRVAVVRMLGLLERRCARAGLPRPRYATPSRWLAEVSERMVVAAPSIRPLSDEITAFVRLADQALYAPAFAGGKAEEACRSAGRIWSWKHLMAVMSLKRLVTTPNAGKHLNKELS